MLTSLLAAAVLFVPACDDDDGPDPAVVEKAVEALDRALKKGAPAEQVRVIAEYGKVADAKVVDLLGKAVRDKDKEREVLTAALKALRYQEHAGAVGLLLDAYKRDKRFRKDESLHFEMVVAIGQHGDPRAIDALADHDLAGVDRRVFAARLYSLGNIRSTASVEALLDMMSKGGSGRRGRGEHPFMDEFRLALARLTGEEELVTQEEWTGWWREHKKGFEVAEKAPKLSKENERRWDRFWRDPDADGERRRGGDGEGDDARRRRRGGEDDGGA